MIDLAKKLQEAGSTLIVLECMKQDLSKKITDILKIPTIGIGASIDCDGQVLVTDDILNLDNNLIKPRFIKSYLNGNSIIEKAIKHYSEDVVNKKFPKKENTY